ncbi:MAG: TM2 domain-containing protein [Methylococcaceae bacterium]
MIIGQIESYDSEKQTGIVKSQDDFFEFNQNSWKSSVPPDQGDEVTFELNEGVAMNMRLAIESLKPVEAVKRKSIAALLALFLGFAGVHRFYLGFYKLGLAQIAVTALTQGYGVLWGFIEAVLLFAGHINKDAKNRPLK